MKYTRNIDDSVKIIALDFILYCPASVKKGNQIFPVSRRGCSFKERGIQKTLLQTMLSQVKKELPSRKCYLKIKAGESLVEKIHSMGKTDVLSDLNHEYIVLCEHSSMSETEAVFYYIRNAFAHGSFSVEDVDGSNRRYLLECDKDDIPKARMLLKESTLKRYRDLIRITPKELAALQKKRKSLTYQ